MAWAHAWLERHRFVLGFALLSLFMGVSVGLAKVTTSLYALHLGASGWTLGAIAAAQSVGILLTALPMGFWVERFGPRRLFMAGSLIGGVLYLLLPLVPHSAFLLAMTAITGLVMPARFVSLQMVFMGTLHRIGAQNAGWQRAAHMSGMFLLGPLLTAGVVQNVGHAGSYWCVAVLFFITIALSHRVLRQPLPATAPTLLPASPAAPQGIRQALTDMLRHPNARHLAWQEAAIQALNMYYAFFIVVIAVQQLHIAPVAAGSLVAVQGAAFIGALLLLGGWVQRLGRHTFALGVGLVLLAVSVLGLGQHIQALWAGGALLGLGLGLLEIQVLTQFAQLGRQLGLGRVAGLNAIAGPGGAMLGALVGGTLGSWWGLQNIFWLFVPVFALLAYRRHRTA